MLFIHWHKWHESFRSDPEPHIYISFLDCGHLNCKLFSFWKNSFSTIYGCLTFEWWHTDIAILEFNKYDSNSILVKVRVLFFLFDGIHLGKKQKTCQCCLEDKLCLLWLAAPKSDVLLLWNLWVQLVTPVNHLLWSNWIVWPSFVYWACR